VGICDWSAITDTQNDLTLPECNMDPGKHFKLLLFSAPNYQSIRPL
jgi:hypothetical protein